MAGNGTHVVRETQHDFRRAIPARRDVFRHETLVARSLGRAAARRVSTREAEIADLELAVCVDEQVSRLEVAVQNVRGMDVLEPAERLVDERLEVRIGQRLPGADLISARGDISALNTFHGR